MFLSVYEIYRGYVITTNSTQKTRFRYLLLALILIILAASINFTPLGKYPIDFAINGMAALLITYSILRHQLIEIRLVVRTGLLYTILTAIVGAVNYLVIFITINSFEFITSDNLIYVSILIAILTSVILTHITWQPQQSTKRCEMPWPSVPMRSTPSRAMCSHLAQWAEC